jgi:hypothetical protein
MKQKAKDIGALVEGVVEQDVFKKMDKKGIEKALQLVGDNPFIQFAYVVNTEGEGDEEHHPDIRQGSLQHYGWTRTSPTAAGSSAR